MENASKALLIAGGMLLALIVISIFILGYTNITNLAQLEVDEELREEIDRFNRPYLAFNKKAMYGTDVISILNLAISNNSMNNVKKGEELYVDISFKLTKDSVKNTTYRHTLDPITAREKIELVGKKETEKFSFEVNHIYSLSQNLTPITAFLQTANISEEVKKIINSKDAIVTEYEITYSGIADFKRKTFKCSKVEYDSYGRINALEFEQITESNYGGNS